MYRDSTHPSHLPHPQHHLQPPHHEDASHAPMEAPPQPRRRVWILHHHPQHHQQLHHHPLYLQQQSIECVEPHKSQAPPNFVVHPYHGYVHSSLAHPTHNLVNSLHEVLTLV
uniref:Uncharacterized protein n=1 Tax=Lygus hesperus TaxID=30085 RepID=A0A0A9YG18_LYGHE